MDLNINPKLAIAHLRMIALNYSYFAVIIGFEFTALVFLNGAGRVLVI